MMPSLDIPWITNHAVSAVAGGGVLLLAGALLRWGYKVDKAINLSVVSLAQIADQLEHHDARLERVEEVVALRPKRRYSSRKKRPKR